MEHIPPNDRYPLRRELRAQMSGKPGVKLNRDDVGGARGQGPGNGARSGADLDDGPAGQVAKRRGDAINGVCIAEKVLSESGFGGHGLT